MIKVAIILIQIACANFQQVLLKSHPDARIIGGKGVYIKDYPYQVSLETYREKHRCGGTIISQKHVVTAAHCVYDVTVNDIYVRAGTSFVNDEGYIYKINKTIIHPNFSSAMHRDYDIAILEVKGFINFGPNIQPAMLPKKNEYVYPGTKCVVTGWGHMGDGVPLAIQLQAADINIVDFNLCQQEYRQQLYIEITNHMICAGVPNGSRDSCKGDSGGPLTINGNVLIGIVSFGEKCGTTTLPSIYTNVASLRNFIRNNAGV